MTAKNRTTIKSVFEQGDKPQGSDYADLIDSYASLTDTTAQSFSSPLVVTGSMGASTDVSANSVEASSASFTQASAATLTANALTVTTVVSADTVAASAAAFTIASAATLNAAVATIATLTLTGFVTAMATAAASAGSVHTVPTTAAGYITVQVCGATVAIPYFPV